MLYQGTVRPEAQKAQAATARDAAVFQKTKLCKWFQKSRGCARGAECSFAHGLEHLQASPDLYKTQLCRTFLRTRSCKDGDSCNFAHSRKELRNFTSPEVCAAAPRTAAHKPTAAPQPCHIEATELSQPCPADTAQPYLKHADFSMHPWNIDETGEMLQWSLAEMQVPELDGSAMGDGMCSGDAVGWPWLGRQLPQEPQISLTTEDPWPQAWASLPEPAKVWVSSSASTAASDGAAKVWDVSSSSTTSSDGDFTPEARRIQSPHMQKTAAASEFQRTIPEGSHGEVGFDSLWALIGTCEEILQDLCKECPQVA